MSKLYAIRQTGKSNYWYDFVEDFTSDELNRDCISNNFTYVKECQNSLERLNPAWKNSKIVEFREMGELDDFEDLYYKSIEQRADLEAKLAEKEKEIEKLKTTNDRLYKKNKKLENQIVESNIRFYKKGSIEQLEKVKELIQNAVNIESPEYDLVGLYDAVSNQIKQLKEMKSE